MKKALCILMLLVSMLINGLSVAREADKDIAVYAVIINGRKYTNGSSVKIIQLNTSKSVNRKARTVECFHTDMELHAYYYQEYGFSSMQDASDTLYLIRYDQPWRMDKFPTYDVGTTFPYEKDGKTFLGVMVGDFIHLIDIRTFETTDYEIKAGNLGDEIVKERMDYLGFDIIDGNFKMIPNGDSFPYQPPREIVKDANTAVVALNNPRYIAFQLNKYGKNNVVDITLAILNKSTNQWRSFKIRGNMSWGEAFPPFMIYRVGNAKGSSYPTEYNGEFVAVNYKTGDVVEFYLTPSSKVLYTNDRCVIAKTQNKLVYIPIVNGKIATKQAEILYEDKKDDAGTEKEIVPYIDRVFLGPKKLPEGILIKKAYEANLNGEKSYKKGNLEEALDYFILATEYAPQFDRAFCNLGLTYLKLEQYDQAIESSKKAIERSSNNRIKAEAFYVMGRVYEERRRWVDALGCYKKSLSYVEKKAYQEKIREMRGKIKQEIG